MDLVGPGPLDPHFDDALAVARAVPARGAWVDLGSGAGFPGVALAALHPEATVTLAERRQKRAVFLETVLSQAGLPNARVHAGDVAALPSAAFDGVVSRAFAPPEAVATVAARLLRPGGTLALLLARERPTLPPPWRRFHVEPYLVDGKERRVELWIYGDRSDSA